MVGSNPFPISNQAMAYQCLGEAIAVVDEFEVDWELALMPFSL